MPGKKEDVSRTTKKKSFVPGKWGQDQNLPGKKSKDKFSLPASNKSSASTPRSSVKKNKKSSVRPLGKPKQQPKLSQKPKKQNFFTSLFGPKDKPEPKPKPAVVEPRRTSGFRGGAPERPNNVTSAPAQNLPPGAGTSAQAPTVEGTSGAGSPSNAGSGGVGAGPEGKRLSGVSKGLSGGIVSINSRKDSRKDSGAPRTSLGKSISSPLDPSSLVGEGPGSSTLGRLSSPQDPVDSSGSSSSREGLNRSGTGGRQDTIVTIKVEPEEERSGMKVPACILIYCIMLWIFLIILGIVLYAEFGCALQDNCQYDPPAGYNASRPRLDSNGIIVYQRYI